MLYRLIYKLVGHVVYNLQHITFQVCLSLMLGMTPGAAGEASGIHKSTAAIDARHSPLLKYTTFKCRGTEATAVFVFDGQPGKHRLSPARFSSYRPSRITEPRTLLGSLHSFWCKFTPTFTPHSTLLVLGSLPLSTWPFTSHDPQTLDDAALYFHHSLHISDSLDISQPWVSTTRSRRLWRVSSTREFRAPVRPAPFGPSSTLTDTDHQRSARSAARS